MSSERTGTPPQPPSQPIGGEVGRAGGATGRALTQARFDIVTMLRNGEQLLLTMVLPTLILVILSRYSVPGVEIAPDRHWIDLAAPGVMALAVISTAFTGQAIGTGFDRRHGVLRMLATTPLGRGGLLAGRMLAVLAIEAVQVVVLGALALALGWRPSPAGLPAAVLLVLVGTAAFVALGLLLAGTVRAEGVLAAANLVWVLLLAGGGVVAPTSVLGPWGALARLLPSGALGDGLRTATVEGRLDLAALAVLLVWAGVASAMAARFFRWD
jgi:ABC-2 type transport system permease protein